MYRRRALCLIWAACVCKVCCVWPLAYVNGEIVHFKVSNPSLLFNSRYIFERSSLAFHQSSLDKWRCQRMSYEDWAKFCAQLLKRKMPLLSLSYFTNTVPFHIQTPHFIQVWISATVSTKILKHSNIWVYPLPLPHNEFCRNFEKLVCLVEYADPNDDRPTF